MENERPLKNIVALMTVRNEQDYLDFNINYHLQLGFDALFIVDHCSEDSTREILETYSDDDRVIVFHETDPIFDHARIINKLLNFANQHFEINWFYLLDADEFLSIATNVQVFTESLQRRNIFYASVGWVNALFIENENARSPVDTNVFYIPWPERSWQHEGHFRKAIVRNHDAIEAVVGGHYFKIENNSEFYESCREKPFLLSRSEAKLLHFEFRNNANNYYNKLSKLAANEKDSSSDEAAPWIERIVYIREFCKKYHSNYEEIHKGWFVENRTIWGTLIKTEQKFIDNSLKEWFQNNYREKFDNICLKRIGHLGDVIMTEPIARYFKGKYKNVYLATDYTQVHEILADSYTAVMSFADLKNSTIMFDREITMIYELSSNQFNYIEAFAEHANVVLENSTPTIKGNWQRMVKSSYILIAPETSNWNYQKRNWGRENFDELARKLRQQLNTEVIILEYTHSFLEMLSLIEHADLVIGNDSAPAIIAQCYKKKAIVIFGGTEPKYVIWGKSNSTPIYNKYAHTKCSHKIRQEEMDCRSSFCMAEFSIEDVFRAVLIKHEAPYHEG
jgi:hypothetical protein